MTTPTIAEQIKYADLQMAAEAFIRDKNTLELYQSRSDLIRVLKAGNGHSSRFTQTQAETFVDTWQVVDQLANTHTGFSGTLFRARKDDLLKGIKANDLVISFRSTEFIDDAIRDNGTNTLEIKDTGFAWGQIRDMEDWYTRLQSQGLLPSGESFSVTGYSLGGHLATVFNLLRREEGIDQRKAA